MVVAGGSAMVLFNFFDTTHLAWADQTCTLCPPVMTPTQDLDRFTAVIGFQGRAYVANWTGSVAVVEISQLRGQLDPNSVWSDQILTFTSVGWFGNVEVITFAKTKI